MASGASEPERRARARVRAKRRRDARERVEVVTAGERDLLTEAVGADGREKRAWLTAQKAALELHEKMGTLVARSYVISRLSEVARVVSEALDKIPTRIAHDLASESDPARVREILSCEIRSALSGLADALEVGSTSTRDLELDREAKRAGHSGVKRARRLQ